MRLSTAATSVLALSAALGAGQWAGGCGPIGPRSPGPTGGQYTEFAPHYPFVPVRVDIHPATRLARDASGQAYIRVYLQFRDRWSDTVKTIGRFEIYMFADGVEQMNWGEVNLSDDRVNNDHYDPVTGMYAMNLYDLPDWLNEIVLPSDRAVEAPVPEAPGPIALRVRFILPGPDGPEEMSDDYYLRP